MKTIGILAGSGQFPFLVARGAKEAGNRVVAVGFEGNTDPTLATECAEFSLLNLGQLGAVIDFFKKNQVTQVCMAGAIDRPKAFGLKPDMRAAKLLFQLMGNKGGNKGDNIILSLVAKELASEGIDVVLPEALVPSLIVKDYGLLAGPQPSPEVWADIALGWKKAKVLGTHDIGQCVAVREGVIVAVEDIGGTDALIQRAGQLATEKTVLVKTFKPNQDERLDKPSIGSMTIQNLVDNGFICLAYEADMVLFFDREKSLNIANKASCSIVAIPSESESFFADKLGKN